MNWDSVQLLALRSLAGDKLAYREFLSECTQLLRPRFARILPAYCVEDALQETLLAIHKSLHTLDTTKSIAPWIYAIAHYKAQDQLRHIYKQGQQEEFVENLIHDNNPTPNVDHRLQVNHLLARLNMKESEILQLLKVEELSIEEISEKMQMSASNVKVTAFRAIRKLREFIAEEEFHEHR